MSVPRKPPTKLTATVLDAPDPHRLAVFYQQLLGWEITADEPGWVKVNPPGGGTGLSFSEEPLFRRPTWPSAEGAQQMMMHLDVEVEDLAEAEAYALSLGAQPAAFQPQDDTRVFYDPAGHPFCLWVRT
ncbi:VOC family protein [Streptomyces sp. NPDC051940]|uniref:VOC family protein n=1 Tax=Streptomyces sp. NPDC051940 TaxID=3155675 RepID=UPI0034400B52